MENNRKEALFVRLDAILPMLQLATDGRTEPSGYMKLTSSGIDAFYDWLRDPGGRIIGVRYSPSSEDADKAVSFLPKRPYIERSRGALEIFFRDTRAYSPEKSSDQAFGGCDIYRNSKHEWLFSFDLYSLNAPELASLRKLLK